MRTADDVARLGPIDVDSALGFVFDTVSRVKKALDEQKPKILGAGIDVTASGGAITLWGTAASNDERSRAGRVAAKVEGVKSLENKLEIVSGS